jgi:NADPH:quinone reductase-like Zn-dependent oxidoreductase
MCVRVRNMHTNNNTPTIRLRIVMPSATTAASTTTTTSPTTAVPPILNHLFSVKGKNVLITGGTRGIGLMIAKTFVQAGANVLLTSRSDEACREAARETLSQHYVASNVSNREGCEALAQHVSQVFHQRLDVLINNVRHLCGTATASPTKIVPCVVFTDTASLSHHLSLLCWIFFFSTMDEW